MSVTIKITCFFTLACLVTILQFGCQSVRIDPNTQTFISRHHYDDAFEIAESALKASSFDIATSSHRMGKIRTAAHRSPPAVIIWSDQNLSMRHRLLSSFNTLRRIATVHLTPVEDEFLIECIVIIEKEEQLDRQFTTSRANSQIVRPLSEIPQDNLLRGVKQNHWRPLQRDPALEALIMKRIRRDLRDRLILKAVSKDSLLDSNPLLDLPIE